MKGNNMQIVQLIGSTNANSSLTSAFYDLGDNIDYAIQVDFSGSNLAGTLSLQAAIDPSYGWVDVTDSTQAVINSDDHVWNVTGAGYRYIRVVWTYASGSGNIQAILFLKKV
jgi:hypothetical protein